MAQITRQSELFAAEDWTVIYRAFTEINFNAFDFDTIKDSMVDYIRFNFPEDFNDWIESSEFVALIDLLAYLGQSMAFRMDLNSQENFIDTVERRESILRMARLLSYTPSRNIPARGVAKITQVKTTEDIRDSLNQTLQNLSVEWNDSNNEDWYEQFSLIMNAAFIASNPFGKPVKNGTVDSIATDLYQLSTAAVDVGQYSFTATVNSKSMPFEIVNPNFDTGTTFYEREPNPAYSYHVIHRNDGNGNGSANTGFFVYFKQGRLDFQDFQLTLPIENRVLDINVSDINQYDVWVQTINDAGGILTSWESVPAVVGNNVIYNSLTRSQRDIYSIITRDNDEVSLRFADGVFGNVPTDTLRAYYRVSDNSSYSIYPQDMRDVEVDIPYLNSNNERHTLTVTFSLQNSVANSVPTETLEQIKRRAPQVYYTQNRMVNGEDYNVFPLQNSEILKLKAINREYSGHSRYLDINSPTSTTQDTNVFADDGLLYREYDNGYVEVPLSDNKTSGEIASSILSPLLKDIEMTQFFYDKYSKFDLPVASPDILWERASQESFSATGQFISAGGATADDVANNLGGTALNGGSTLLIDHATTSLVEPENFITEGALVEFRYGKWAKVQTVVDNGNGFYDSGKGRVTISEAVATNDQVLSIFPAFRTELTNAETTLVKNEIDERNTFGLRYDHTDLTWKIISAANLAPNNDDNPFSLTNAGDTTLTNLDASWLVRFDFDTDVWKITSKGLRFVWESVQDVRFFVNQFYNIVSSISGRSSRDTMKVFKTVAKPGTSVIEAFGEDIPFSVKDVFTYSDGYQEPRRVLVGFMDADDDGVPDDPEIFNKVVLTDSTGSTIPELEQYIFHKKITDQYGYEQYEPILTISTVQNVDQNPPAFGTLTDGDILFSLETGSPATSDLRFYQYDADAATITALVDQTAYQYKIGRSGLDFVWNHVVDTSQRVDPAITNIIDIFALTLSYDTDYRRYLISTDTSATAPDVPTTEQLRIDFAEFEASKMTSDQIIWKPVKYKPLFGSKASEELRVIFKVVKVAGTDVNDNEIKSQIISYINTFFSVDNFDFGDTFFGSELTAYIHSQMATTVGGIEIVPINEESRFGALQEIKAGVDEVFISAATVADIDIVPAFTNTVLRVGN